MSLKVSKITHYMYKTKLAHVRTHPHTQIHTHTHSHSPLPFTKDINQVMSCAVHRFWVFAYFNDYWPFRVLSCLYSFFEGCLREGVRFPFQRLGWQSDVWNSTRIPEGAALISVMSATQTDKSWWPSNVPCTTTSGQVVREHGKCLCIPLPLKRSGLLANICAVTQGRNRPKVKGEEKVKPHYSPDTKTREQFLGPADTGFIRT